MSYAHFVSLSRFRDIIMRMHYDATKVAEQGETAMPLWQRKLARAKRMSEANLWYVIFKFLDFETQLGIIFTSKFFRDNLFITDLYNIDRFYLKKLTNNILRFKIFKYVIKLNVDYNKKIKNISFMTNLKKLNAELNCGIDQKGIDGLDLIYLNIWDNEKIKNVSFMTNLQYLDACYDCGINQDGIEGLNLTYLNASNNKKITNVSFMTNLQYLNAIGNCRISPESIKSLKIKELHTFANPNFKK